MCFCVRRAYLPSISDLVPDDGFAENKRGKVRKNVTAFAKQFCRGEAVSITYSESVLVVLIIQHAMRIHHIILPSVPCLGVP